MRLRPSSCDDPGYRRHRCGRGFRYTDVDGRPLTDPGQLARIRALTIPPAWRDVWICPWPGGHLQAVGTDDAGRRQYLYHEQFRAEQGEGQARARAAGRPGPAGAARPGGARPGPTRTEPAAGHRLRGPPARPRLLPHRQRPAHPHQRDLRADDHAPRARQLRPGRDHLQLPGQGRHRDRPRPRRRAGPRGGPRPCCAARAAATASSSSASGAAGKDLHGDDLNEALRRLSGTDVTAKDFRTWHATVLAAVAVAVVPRDARATEAARRRQIARAVREVSHYLGNTPRCAGRRTSIQRCSSCSSGGVTVAPVLTRLGEHGSFGRPATQGAVEAAVLDLLDGAAG